MRHAGSNTGTHPASASPTTRRAGRRWSRYFLGVLALTGLLFESGCRSTGGKSKDGTPVSRTRDPLLGGRIPPQNLPIPGRDSFGARQRRDPLLDSPNGGSTDPGSGTERTDRGGSSEDHASRGSQAYRPDRGSTNAALAARMTTDDTLLSIDRRPDGNTTGRNPVPLTRGDDTTSTGGWNYDQIVGELRRYGATFSSPVRQAEEYVFQADVPLNAERTRIRRYEGIGTTPATAAKQVLDQVRADTGGK